MDAQKLKFMMSMQQEIDKLKATLGENNSVVLELVKQFEILSQSEINKTNNIISSNDLIAIKMDTKIIRECLEIRGDYSIDYSFITNKKVKEQLMIDNLKMENSFLDTTLKDDTERFYNFCVNAFHQMEELINYYFGMKYKFDDFKKLISSINRKNTYYQTQLSKITIAEKIFVFENLFYYNRYDASGRTIYYESIISLIREVRNLDSHRCNIIEKDNDKILIEYNVFKTAALSNIKKYKSQAEIDIEKQAKKEIEKQVKLITFIKDKNYNLIRETVKELSLLIKANLPVH